MKKLIALLLALVMMLSMAACQSSDNNEEDENENVEKTVNSSLEVLEKVWEAYGEDEMFPVIGGNMESPVDGAPGNYDMTYAENLTYNLLIPADQLANVDEAATMIHMMNANTFTAGVVHLTEGTDAAAFAETMQGAIQSNQWMCGFPDSLLIVVFDGEYVLVAYGVNDAMDPFQTHLEETYPEAEILYDEAIAG